MSRFYLLMILFFPAMMSAQEVTLQTATALFEKGDFNGAANSFSKLLQKSTRDVKINYLYGASLTESNQNLSEAIKRLKFAQVNNGPMDVAFYQGRAAQLNYEYEQAVGFYTKYLKFGKNKLLLARAGTYMNESKASVGFASKIFDLKVISKQRAAISDFASYYHPGKDVGAVLRNSSFFEAGVDPNGYLYKTERGDAVYYAQLNSNGTNDLYRIEKLIDGWGESVGLSELNSVGDDLMPFLMVDGVTIYFCSNREGGMGGFDIYKSTYDTENNLYSEPVNLGVPFNSAFDDYLFVADEFKNVAWFASNRFSTADSVDVFQIVWDNSVIRNMAMNTDEIRRAARLAPDSSQIFHPASDSRPFVADKRIAKPAVLFRFVVNDTLTYTDWSQFKSEQAKAEYKNGFDLKQKKDSLNDKMSEYRRLFSSTSNETERNLSVNEILKMEREVYGIDELIERHYIKARLLEINYLKEYKDVGSEVPASQNGSKVKQESEIDRLLIPSKFTYYTDDEFDRQLKEWDLMYARLFDSSDRQELHRADSLYVWGNILTLEASRLKEQILKTGATGNNGLILKNSAAAENAEELSRTSKLYKATALNLYHQTLDTKYRLFTDKINEIELNELALNFDAVEDKQTQASSYYSKANELAPELSGDDFELYERAGTYKRQAVHFQTEGLFLYLNHLDGSARLGSSEPAVKSLNQPVEKELKPATTSVTPPVRNVSVTEKEQSINAPKGTVQAAKPQYRIQLGVFKNHPNSVAMSQLPAVRQTVLENGIGTRYYCGEFSTYEEAAKFVPKARELGFAGAFVIAFVNGVQISVAKAKEME